MQLGYNTNGFAFHSLEDAIEVIARLGYRSVAITIDHHALNPFLPHTPDQLARVRKLLADLHLSSVIETGARFLLDPMRKHSPTLLDRRSGGRDKRLDFLRRCIDTAAELNSTAISFWSGAAPEGIAEAAAYDSLASACIELADYAAAKRVTLAFEPEPGMYIDNLEKYDRLAKMVAKPNFRLTIDVGHLWCTEGPRPAEAIPRFASHIANIHLDDVRGGRHDHLFFGEGDVDFPAVFRALDVIHYDGPACVELSRHSHDAVETARRAKQFIDRTCRESLRQAQEEKSQE